MTLIVAGTVRVPAENVERFRPHMVAMMTASRAEDGCIAYGYAENVSKPGLIHVFEVWRDQAALEAHFRTPHMANWRAQWPSFGVSDRRLTAYEVATEPTAGSPPMRSRLSGHSERRHAHPAPAARRRDRPRGLR